MKDSIPQLIRQGKNISFPLLEEVDIRTETRDLDFPSQEYMLRLSPSTPGKRKAQKALYQTLRDAPDFDQQEFMCKRKVNLYEDWLELYTIRTRLDLLLEYEKVLNDRQMLMEKLVGTYTVDSKSLINLEIQQNDLKIDRYFLEQEAREKCGLYGIEFDDIRFDGFLEAEKVKDRLNVTGQEDQKLLFDQEMIQRELALEKAEGRQYFDFLQFKYQGPHTDQLNERFSLGLGFNISSSGSKKLKIQELQFEKEALDHKAELDSKEKEQKLLTLKQNVLRRLTILDFRKQMMVEEEQRLDSLGQLLMQKEGFDPMLILEMKERRILVQIELAKQKASLLAAYIEYLDEANTLCSEASPGIYFKD